MENPRIKSSSSFSSFTSLGPWLLNHLTTLVTAEILSGYLFGPKPSVESLHLHHLVGGAGVSRAS
ncbi:hypothetical protein U1Q18_007334, partial [Sarracenia purpurea var. burkii]